VSCKARLAEFTAHKIFSDQILRTGHFEFNNEFYAGLTANVLLYHVSGLVGIRALFI
jgi:hypothetical protein